MKAATTGWDQFDAWLRPAAPAERLALLRIATGLFALVYLIARAPALMSYARVSQAAFAPVGPVGLLLSAPLRPWAVTAMGVLSIVASLAFVLGWRFRWLGPVAAATVTWTLSYRSSWGMIFHTENMLVLQLWLLALSPSADVLALDAKPINKGCCHPRYGWPLRLICLVVVTTYVLAGVAKLKAGGMAWLSGDTLRVLVAHDNLRKISVGAMHSPLAKWLVPQAWLWPPLAWLSLVVELGAPLALVHRRAAALWCFAAWGFHINVLALMAILFPFQLLGLPYLAFFPIERISSRLRGHAVESR